MLFIKSGKKLWKCHSIQVFVAQSCPTLCNPMDCISPGSSVHGILQARVLEWVAIPFSRGSSRSRDRTRASCIAGRFLTIWALCFKGNLLISTLSSFFSEPDWLNFFKNNKKYSPRGKRIPLKNFISSIYKNPHLMQKIGTYKKEWKTHAFVVSQLGSNYFVSHFSANTYMKILL